MNWCRGKLIGYGSTAQVFLAKSLPNGEIFVVKSVEVSKSSALQKEQEIHSSLQSDRIIMYHGCGVTVENGKSFYNIFLEYAPSGTLIDVIKMKDSALDQTVTKRYTREILYGLEYLHSRGIVHCDVKGGNILVTNEGVKIGDFGCCKWVDDVAEFDSSSVEIGGTPMYMAPEVARGEQQSYPADVWALGCTVFEMVTGMSPWPNIAQDPYLALYHIGFSGAFPEIPDSLSGQAKDFLSKCFMRDPKERWSVAELLKHPFVIDDGPTKEPILYTPTSILDQGIWAKTLELTFSSPKNVAQHISTKSPSERIRELMVDLSRDEFPNWASDEDWITLRTNDSCDGTEGKFSGPSLAAAQNMKPNMKNGNFVGENDLRATSEHKFLFRNVELLNCCNYNIHSIPTSKYINDVIMKSDFNCTCMDVKFRSINLMEDFLPTIFCPP